MNEQIFKLAQQANLIGDWGEDITKGRYFVFDNLKSLEKFAESIVQECVSIVAKRKDQAIDDGCNVDEAMSVAEMDLLEHFGVEE